jgi:Tyrosine phosphatase family
METGPCLVSHGRGSNSRLATYPPEPENPSDPRDFDVHCLCSVADGRSGIHEVGILVGILRKLQHWSLSSIIFEYRSFAGPNARFNEEQFIELFNESELQLPHNLPTWWIEQQELWRVNAGKK